MYLDEEQLKTFLLRAGLAGRELLEEAHQEARRKRTAFHEELMGSEHLSEESVKKACAHVLGIPYVCIREEELDPEVLMIIPEPLSRRHNACAFKRDDTTLFVAFLDIEDLKKLSFLSQKTGLIIRPSLTDSASLRKALLLHQKHLTQTFGGKIRTSVKALPSYKQEKDDEEVSTLALFAQDEATENLLSLLIEHARLFHATDIHIEPLEKSLRVRYRILGALYSAMELPELGSTLLVARAKFLCGLSLSNTKTPQEGRCSLTFSLEKVSLRISTMPTRLGEKMIIRILEEGMKGFTFSGLGFVGENLALAHELVEKKEGLVLITGPAQSGKTTLLYTILDTLNSGKLALSSVEDPIEYQLPYVNQTQVNVKEGLTFSRAFRGVLRQDPDVVALSEIQGSEILSLSAQAALNGKRVFATIHTNKQRGEVPLLLEKGGNSPTLSSALSGIITCRLMRRLSENTKRVKLTKKEFSLLKEKVNTRKLLRILREEGIIGENETWRDIHVSIPEGDGDYDGVVGVYSVLMVTQAVKDLLAKDATPLKIEEEAIRHGAPSLLEDGIIKAVEGKTSLDEVFRVCMS
ncbi:MAG: ATPase, T2SS/T4P/T4SS family [Candidatus Paceibacterota bacterium]